MKEVNGVKSLAVRHPGVALKGRGPWKVVRTPQAEIWRADMSLSSILGARDNLIILACVVRSLQGACAGPVASRERKTCTEK